MKKINRFLMLFFCLVLTTTVLSAQELKLSGKVTDKSNLAIPGVNVVIKGTTNGIITDGDGNYTLVRAKNDKVLVFSFVGMRTQEVAITGNVINVVLEDESIGLDEVVAVGYGVQKKSDLTGSVSSVKADEMVKMPIARVDQALQGKISGVTISNDKAQPGASPVIRIRGDNSISGDNSPLVVIDGILGGDMNVLNPSEIESVEVLKDASSKAIYGSRGANGVIIVTTKRGKEGKTRFDFSTYGSVSQVANKLDLMTAEQQYNLLKTVPVGADRYADIQGLIAKYDPSNPKGTDWQDEILRDAPTQSYSLNITGGNKNTTFVISGSYFDQQGIIKKSGYERQTLRARVDHKVNDKLKLGVNLFLGKSKQNNSKSDAPGGSEGGGATQSANRFTPIIPVYDNAGNYSSAYPVSAQLNNPMALINERKDILNTFSATANLYADYKVLDNLTFRTTYTSAFANNLRNYWAGKKTLEASGIGRASIESYNENSWLNENTLTFDETYGKHHVTVMGGITGAKYNTPGVQASSMNFPTEALGYYSLELGIPSGQSTQSSYSENTMMSYLGRVNYVLADKYMMTVNFRADGSSKFAKNNKWGYFPSVALGWRVNEESFLKNVKEISNLKLRLSYGSTGSQAISPYQSLASYTNGTIPLGSSFYTAVNSDRIPNPDLKWETTTEGNFGFDLGLLNNRITLTADVYQKDTKDLLYSKNLPYFTGYSAQTQNIGKIRNRGFEFSLNTINLDGVFKWSTNFNLSLNRNKVIDLGGDQFQILDFSGGSLGAEWAQNAILKVGEPLGNFYGYVFDGIYQNAAETVALEYPVGSCKPGQIKLKDISGPNGAPDGKITPDDRTIIGNGLPDFSYGFSNDFSFRNFDLNVMFQGVQGNDILNLNRVTLERVGTDNGLAVLATNGWTGEGTSNTIQSVVSSVGPVSSRFVEDGSYLRLKNLSLGYTLPKQLIQKWNIANLRVYVSGQNLFTITNYSGYDPEINSRSGNLGRGIDYGGYPTAKTYTVGLNLSF